MKSSIKITNGGNTIHATGDAANELFKAFASAIEDEPDEAGEDIFTPIPSSCQKFACVEHHVTLKNIKGFMVCPRCGVSYGRPS